MDGLVKPLGLLQAEAPPLGQHLLLQACRTVALSATVGQIQKTRLEGGFFVFGALGSPLVPQLGISNTLNPCVS